MFNNDNEESRVQEINDPMNDELDMRNNTSTQNNFKDKSGINSKSRMDDLMMDSMIQNHQEERPTSHPNKRILKMNRK